MGLSTIHKVTAALRQLAYGAPADAVDEYVRIGESTAIESLWHFCRGVVKIFGGQYLRAPSEDDIKRILEVNTQQGFQGMLGSLDCMHWRWRNCPSAWSGQFTGKEKEPKLSQRQSLRTNSGYGMLFLACPAPITISMFLTGLPDFLT